MPKKSILYIITKSVWGGAGKYVYDLATNLSGDFNVSVAAGSRDVLAQRLIEANIPYYEIKNFQRDINFFKEPLAGLEILRLLFKLKPDIIHTNSSKAGGMVGITALIYQILTFRRLKMIFTAHGWAFAEDRPQIVLLLIKFLSKITTLFYDKIISVSEYDRQLAIKNNIAPIKKLITIHNGVSIKNFFSRENAQKELMGKTSPLTIGTIAEWHRNKGLFYLLEAIKSLDFKPDIVMIGSGENRDKEKLLKYIEQNRLRNIYLREFVPNAAAYLKAFDIFVLPSIKEGLPYTLLEAILAKVPIVATNVGGIPEIIFNGMTGFLVNPKDSRNLAEKMTYLAENLETFTQNLKKRLPTNRFSLEKMLKKTKDLYN